MQKKFLTNLGFLLLVNLLIKPFYILGIDAEVQNAASGGEYGLYFALFNFTFLFNILKVALCLTLTLTRVPQVDCQSKFHCKVR